MNNLRNIKSKIEKISNKKKYVIIYSLLFLFLSFFFYSFYFLNGKAFINLNGDGYRQCYRAIIYYQKYLKEIFDSIFINHQLIIPQWDFSIGEGSDIIQTLNYYVIGDPFALLCIFIPYDYLYLYIDIAAFARLYFAGLFFGMMCFYFDKKNVLSVTIGSLSYAFCFFGIMYAINFPFMLSYMVYMPLIVIGVEKIVNSESPLILIIAVMLSAFSSLPYFYMVIIFTAIYCLIRAICLDITFKQKTLIAFKIVLYSLIGVCLASFIIIPSLAALANNTRLTKSHELNSLLNLKEIISIIPSLVVGNHMANSSVGGITLPVALTLVTGLFSKNKSRTLCILIVVMLVSLCSPLFSQLINGLTTSTERWMGICPLIVCFNFVNYYDELLEKNRNRVLYLLIILVVFVISFYLDKDRLKIHLLLLAMSLLMLLIIKTLNNKKMIGFFLLLVSICCISLNIYNLLSPSLWDYTNKATNVSILNEKNNKETAAIDSIDDDSFYRYSGNQLVCNESSGGSNQSTNFYWSFPNNDVVNFRTNVGFYDYNLNHYDGYYYRSQLLDLASVKYYLVNDGDFIPYGYEYYKSSNGYDIYKNVNNLPLLYVYENSISYEKWKKLSILERQESLLSNVVLDNGNDFRIEDFSNSSINYLIKNKEDIEIYKNEFDVLNTNNYLELNIEYSGPGEYYLVLNNFDFVGNEKDSTQIYINNSNGTSNTIYHKTKNHSRYSNRNDYAVCLGYIENPIDYIEISFQYIGKYTFDSIEVQKLEVQKSDSNFNQLKDINIEELKVSTNRVDSKIEIDKDKFVCFSIPYSSGWQAYIDGEKVTIQKANVMYMGFEVTKGEHIIELRYSTPYFKPCFFVSMLTMVSLILTTIYKKRKRKK